MVVKLHSASEKHPPSCPELHLSKQPELLCLDYLKKEKKIQTSELAKVLGKFRREINSYSTRNQSGFDFHSTVYGNSITALGLPKMILKKIFNVH